MQSFKNIPQELRDYAQFVCWRFENRGGDKPTKVPYNPRDSRFASVNNPLDWTDFDTAVAASSNFDGIGFVLTISDPFCFIDFDRTDDPAKAHRQIDLHTEFDTYSEVSPGGGLHVICKGMVPSGRRRDAIEIYSSSRFMTMTGNVYHDCPIKFKQDQVTRLWHSLEGTTAANLEYSAHTKPSDKSDREIWDLAANASNGEKFQNLWNGDIETYHEGDHSRSDFALIDILAYYTQDRQQLTRMFRMSGLGRRPKASRDTYVDTMITRSFDRLLPEVDISGLMKQIDEFVETNREAVQEFAISHSPLVKNVEVTKGEEIEDPKEIYTMPPGITGEIAKFIYKQAWKPVPQIATMGALGLMAGLCGRAYNASGSGLNLYLLLLAKTGRGKEAISKAYEKIFDAIAPLMPTIMDFGGPSDLASGQALLRYMSDHQTKSFVSVFGEFGPMLKRITSPTAIGADLMTQKVMLDMYSKSGRSGKISPTAYSDAERNTKTIHSPAFSFIAESAPRWFDENVDIGMIATGLLPRFIVCEYGGIRVPSNEAGPLLYPDQNLIHNICSIATCAMTCFQQNVVKDILFDDYAKTASRKLDQLCDSKINDVEDEIISELWNRAHLNTVRIAGLIAVGINQYSPVIDQECWDWAEKFITHNLNRIIDKFGRGTISSVETEDEFDQVEKIEKVICEFMFKDFNLLEKYGVSSEMYRCKVMPWTYFSRKLCQIHPFKKSKLGATNAIKRGIQNMLDNGDLVEISKKQAIESFDCSGRLFACKSKRILSKVKSTGE